jgi:phage terminase large subunit-like protein
MHHAGEYRALEDHMKSWLPADRVSPDHMDAMGFEATEAFDLNHRGTGSWEDAILGVA